MFKERDDRRRLMIQDKRRRETSSLYTAHRVMRR
jgi:hypothetical protein